MSLLLSHPGGGPAAAVRDRAALGLTRALEGALAALPERAALLLGESMGRLARRPLRIRRAVVERQIAAAFPGRSPSWVRETARGCYLHFGREVAATVRLVRSGRDSILRRTVGAEEVPEVLQEAAAGGGAIVVTGHLGNWELAGSVLGVAGRPVTAVARRQQGPFERRLERLRAALGIETVYPDAAPRRLPRALAAGHVVAMAADQHAGSRGVVVTFMGRRASTYRGPARLALACGVPLLFGALVRDGAGYRALVEPVRTAGDGRPEEEMELTRGWVAHLERAARARPEQYFWFHRRWKAAERAGPAEGPELAERRDGPDGTKEP